MIPHTSGYSAWGSWGWGSPHQAATSTPPFTHVVHPRGTVVLWRLWCPSVQQGFSLCDLHTRSWKGCKTFSLSFCGYESKCMSFFFFFFLFLWKVSGWWTVVVQPQVTHPASILRYCGFSNAYSVVLDGWTEYKLARQFPNLLFSVLYTHKHTHSYINFQTLTHTCTFLTLVLIWSQAYRHSTFSEF